MDDISMLASASAGHPVDHNDDASLTEDDDHHTAMSSSPSATPTPPLHPSTISASASASGGGLIFSPRQATPGRGGGLLSGGSMATEIECGDEIPLSAASLLSENPSGERRYSEYVEYFGKEVEIFYAFPGEVKIRVYRPSEMARLCDCHPSRIGMLLKRKSSSLSGVFRASSFIKKPANSSGLKSGAYFVTLQTCQEIETILRNSNPNRMGSRKRSSKKTSNERHSPKAKNLKSENSKESLTQAKVLSPPSLSQLTPEGGMLAAAPFGSSMFLPPAALHNPVWLSQMALANSTGQLSGVVPFPSLLNTNGMSGMPHSIPPSMLLMPNAQSQPSLLSMGFAGFPTLSLTNFPPLGCSVTPTASGDSKKGIKLQKSKSGADVEGRDRDEDRDNTESATGQEETSTTD